MFGVIAVLIPSVIGIKLFDYLRKGLSLKNTIYYYLIFLGISWIICSSLGSSLFEVNNNLFIKLCNDPFLFSEFTGLNILINVILAILTEVIIRNIKINITTEKVNKKVISNEKKKTKKTK